MKTLGVLTFALVGCLTSAWNVAPASPSTGPGTSVPDTTPNPAFHAILPTLIRKSVVPIFLPTHIPPAYDTPGSMNGQIISLDSRGYEIIVSPLANCKALYCEYATIDGAVIDKETENLRGALVVLSNGTKAYFHRFTCGANCGDSWIEWKFDGYYYAVGIRMGKKSDVVSMANSMRRFRNKTSRIDCDE